MTPKEKANELFNKYFSEIRMPSDCEGCMQCVDRCGNMVAIAKKYSLMAVEEILNNNCGSHTDEANATNSEIYCDEYFWNDVKSELQSL
jgi:hypothetical protein